MVSEGGGLNRASQVARLHQTDVLEAVTTRGGHHGWF